MLWRGWRPSLQQSHVRPVEGPVTGRGSEAGSDPVILSSPSHKWQLPAEPGISQYCQHPVCYWHSLDHLHFTISNTMWACKANYLQRDMTWKYSLSLHYHKERYLIGDRMTERKVEQSENFEVRILLTYYVSDNTKQTKTQKFSFKKFTYIIFLISFCCVN